MANKSKKSSVTRVAKSTSENTSITRIKATDKKPVVIKAKKVQREKNEAKGPLKVLSSMGGYFKGAWFELRQVRWPNRRATWGLTAAVLLFTTFFVVLVVLLDILFKYLFELILG